MIVTFGRLRLANRVFCACININTNRWDFRGTSGCLLLIPPCFIYKITEKYRIYAENKTQRTISLC